MIRHQMINGQAVAHSIFQATDMEGHRREVEEFMAWLTAQKDGSVRAIFEGMDKIDIKANLDYYRQKALQAKPKCGAFAFVGLTGLKAVLFNYVIIFAAMPMKITASLEEAKDWVSRQALAAVK